MQEPIKVKSGSSSLLRIYSSLQQTHWSNETNKKTKKQPLNLTQLLQEIHHILQMCWEDLPQNTEKRWFKKHTTKFKHQTRVVNMLLIERLIKTAASSLAVGEGDNVILRGKDEIEILQNSSKDFFKSIAH